MLWSGYESSGSDGDKEEEEEQEEESRAAMFSLRTRPLAHSRIGTLAASQTEQKNKKKQKKKKKKKKNRNQDDVKGQEVSAPASVPVVQDASETKAPMTQANTPNASSHSATPPLGGSEAQDKSAPATPDETVAQRVPTSYIPGTGRRKRHRDRPHRKKTKKRSKQKNMRKDNRPAHLKPNYRVQLPRPGAKSNGGAQKKEESKQNKGTRKRRKKEKKKTVVQKKIKE